jgi:hypothetical protein
MHDGEVQASSGLLQDKPLRHHARPAARASTGLLQDIPLKHRARTAARASTGLLQDKALMHPARHAPRTRTRLLRAVLKPHALAMQATVETPAQEHAQRVLQASTNQQEAMVIALTVLRASTGLLRDKQLKHRVRSVPRTRTRLLRAVLEPSALAMQATVATPAQEHAQCA